MTKKLNVGHFSPSSSERFDSINAKVCFFIYVYRQIIQNQFTEQQIGKRANLN